MLQPFIIDLQKVRHAQLQCVVFKSGRLSNFSKLSDNVAKASQKLYYFDCPGFYSFFPCFLRVNAIRADANPWLPVEGERGRGVNAMKKPLLGFAALALFAIIGGSAIAQGRGSGGYYDGRRVVHVGGGNWHAGGYYGGWHGHRGTWGGRYWGPGVGLYFGGPTYWGAWPYAYPYGYGYAPYASYAVVGPTVYVEQQIEVPTPPQYDPNPPSVAGNPDSPPTFWFYCTKPAGYYPYVRDCSKTWLRVVPQANTDTMTRPKLAE